GTPVPGQRPAAYIVVLGQSSSRDYLWADAGMACQSMTLGAAERGWGCCLFGSVQREKLRGVLGLKEDDPPVMLVVALGVPDEEFVIEEGTLTGSRDYWREGRVHHVPKLPLSELLLERKGQ
ncbi:MAG: nitroreductase family protein, partial [Firmicutes bacterium]|nr:nitroreductase family protein [Bacillota bacterium]